MSQPTSVDDAIAPEWEQRLAALWAAMDTHAEADFVAAMEAPADELPPGSAVAAFERGGAFDSTGHPERAVPLYREALALGLAPDRRRQAVIQLASSLRNLGHPEESVALLEDERGRGSDDLDDAIAALLAMSLLDAGRARDAVSVAVLRLADRMTRYRRSMTAYGRLLAEPDPA